MVIIIWIYIQISELIIWEEKPHILWMYNLKELEVSVVFIRLLKQEEIFLKYKKLPTAMPFLAVESFDL
jgi:hypothetical protein